MESRTLKDKFLSIAESLVSPANSLTPVERTRCVISCPNQSVGRIGDISKTKSFTREEITKVSQNTKIVLLILESPHTDEYLQDNSGCWRARGPACGCTGYWIRHHLLTVLQFVNSSIDYTQWELLLVNAVRFQCSLGRNLQQRQNRCLKEKILRKCLQTHVFRKDLRDMVRDVVDGRTCLVVNACTKQTRGAVTELLLPNVSNGVVECDHPSSWRRGKARVLWSGNDKIIDFRAEEKTCHS